MMKHKKLTHVFVDTFPSVLESSTLYVSMEYGTVAHKCCCGCGEEVITPLTPTDWKLTFDGVSMSLHPSIGNWDLRCRSHYVIDQGCVIIAAPWSDDKIVAERIRDKNAKNRFYKINKDMVVQSEKPDSNGPVLERYSLGRRDRLKRYLKRWL